MALKDKDGNWLDGTGAAVPPRYVSDLDKRRDALVEEAHKRAAKLRAELEAFRLWIDQAIDKHLEYGAKNAGVEPAAGGNHTLTDFSRKLQVERKQVDYLGFDERLTHGKACLDAAIERLGANAPADLRVILDDAFRVNAKGQLNAREIIGFVRRTERVRDAEWQKGRRLILESVQAQSRRAYIQLRARDPGNGEWRTLRLDLAATGASDAQPPAPRTPRKRKAAPPAEGAGDADKHAYLPAAVIDQARERRADARRRRVEAGLSEIEAAAPGEGTA